MIARQSLPDGLQARGLSPLAPPMLLVSVLTAAKVETVDADSRTVVKYADQQKTAATESCPAGSSGHSIRGAKGAVLGAVGSRETPADVAMADVNRYAGKKLEIVCARSSKDRATDF